VTLVKCFLLIPVPKVELSLRRYRASGDDEKSKCPSKYGYHTANVFIETVYEELGLAKAKKENLPPHDDPRWPKFCRCGYVFEESDHWQVFLEYLFKRSDTGQEVTIRRAPPGAMWNAHWMMHDGLHAGGDGRSMVVKCPPDGYEWHIDGRASNCDMKDDTKHRCWIRHGEPPFITVDKNGFTCGAGAGSIQTPSWHGFLKNGILS
jgi:hypothetical protein